MENKLQGVKLLRWLTIINKKDKYVYNDINTLRINVINWNRYIFKSMIKITSLQVLKAVFGHFWLHLPKSQVQLKVEFTSVIFDRYFKLLIHKKITKGVIIIFS